MKELIISVYDTGFQWTIKCGNRTYERYKCGQKIPNYALDLIYLIESEYPSIAQVRGILWKNQKKTDRIILCVDGEIEVWNERKRQNKCT